MDNSKFALILLFCMSAYVFQTINVITAGSGLVMGPVAEAEEEIQYTPPVSFEQAAETTNITISEMTTPPEPGFWEDPWGWISSRISGGIDWIASGLIWLGQSITSFFSSLVNRFTGFFGPVSDFFATIWAVISFDIFVGVPSGTIPSNIEYFIRLLIAVPVNGLMVISMGQVLSSIVWGG